MTSHPDDREGRFRELCRTHFDPVLASARRRLDQVPGRPEDRLWLFGVARRVLANHRRGGRRRADLGDRLCERLDRNVQEDPSGEVTERVAVAAALQRLSAADREILMLHAWEQLEPREIAVVLDLRPEAVRTRLSRARARLRSLLEAGPETSLEVPGHALSVAGHVTDETRAHPLPVIQETR